MKYTDITKPGMGDPYWYEWSVGIKYIIDMLLPENGIKYVELQANVELGLDDVVVTYNDDNKRFIQVKHTRADNTLTFGNIVSTDKGDEDDHRKISLLNELAKSWSIEKSKYKDTIVCLYTNRKGGSRGSSTQGDNGHKRPPLIKFWQDLKTQLATVSTFEDISFPGYEDAWKEFIEQLSDIPCNKDKLLFLRSLEIDTDRSGLTALEHELINQIKSVFQTTENNAEVILSKFDHALRTWTTSTRETSHITAEDVMDMLSFKTHIEYYNHDLVPNEPFFRSRENLVQSIEKELQQSHEKVIFLSGIPGTGKTNIISKLSAKRNSLVDIRYYAYEPIDPAKEYHPMDVSKRVEKDSFWNEIFDQLRKKLKGQLYKYNVPIMNELMSLSQMKTRFFEIASNYAKDRGICFVIAIDGIDHAARALHFDETFLPDLPYPEYIPENIKIILAGQPKEGYSNYPSWLFSDKENVKQIEIPCIQTEDIQDLVNTHFQSLPNDKQQQMADIITKYADGNTLSAIFAVYEAEQQQDLIELEKRLINRKLSGNIQVYYNAIWKDATSKIGIPFIDYKIAGVFAFINESLNDKKLASIFFEERITPSTWKNVLKTLKPLLLEHDGNYTILHNDVRVFLSGMICVDQEHAKEVYGKLADYYLNMSQKEKAYYKDIYRFLKASERIEDFKLLFSPDYIIEAYVNGVGLDEINRIAQDLLRDIISKDAINWASMRNLALSYLTINQIETSSYEIDGVGFRKEDPYIQYHPYECYVEDESSWGSDLILDVLSLSKRLYDHGYTDRAIQLFKRWFSDISISQFVSCIEAPEDDYRIHTSPQTKEIAKLCGECIVFTADFSLIQGCQEIEKEHYLFVQNVYDSILKTIITECQGEKLSENLEKVDILYLDSLLFCTKHLLDNNRIADMAILEKAFHDRLTHNASGKLFSCFMRIISSNPEWTTEELNEIEAMINSIELTDSLEENDMLYCSIYSFVFSYSRISSSYEESAHIVLEKFMEKHKHLSRKYFGVYFTNICLIGKWIASVHKNMALYFRSDDIKHLLESLLFNKQNPSDGPLFTNTLHSILIKAYIFLSRNGNVQFKTVIDEVCDRAFLSFPINDGTVKYYAQICQHSLELKPVKQ